MFWKKENIFAQLSLAIFFFNPTILPPIYPIFLYVDQILNRIHNMHNADLK